MTSVIDVLTVVVCATCGCNYATGSHTSAEVSFCPIGHQQRPLKTTQHKKWWIAEVLPTGVVETDLTTIVCAACFRPFGVPETMVSARRLDHKTFFCPEGHNNFFPQSPAAKSLEARVVQAEAALALAKGETKDLQAKLDAAEKRIQEAERGYEMTTRERRSLEVE